MRIVLKPTTHIRSYSLVSPPIIALSSSPPVLLPDSLSSSHVHLSPTSARLKRLVRHNLWRLPDASRSGVGTVDASVVSEPAVSMPRPLGCHILASFVDAQHRFVVSAGSSFRVFSPTVQCAADFPLTLRRSIRVSVALF